MFFSMDSVNIYLHVFSFIPINTYFSILFWCPFKYICLWVLDTSLLRVFLGVFVSLIYMPFIVLILFLASSFSLSLYVYKDFLPCLWLEGGFLKKSLECVFQLWIKFYYYFFSVTTSTLQSNQFSDVMFKHDSLVCIVWD